MKVNRPIVALTFAVVAVCSVRVARAGVAVAPLRQEISVRPGRTERFRITITNRVRERARARPESVHLMLADVAVSETGHLSFPEPGSMSRSASDWITLSATEVVLEPGESKRLEGTIAAPHNAAGEYYSAVLVTLGSRGKTAGGVTLTYRVASGLFVNVTGRSFPRRANITRCEIVWPHLDGEQDDGSKARSTLSRPPEIVVALENTGQARFQATGQVRILDENLRTVFLTPLRSNRSRVFGGDSRIFRTLLDKPLPAGQYQLHVEMDYESQWGKARHREPLEITPELARLLEQAAAESDERQAGDILKAEPESLHCNMLPGAFRSFGIVVKNTSGYTVPISAAVTGQDEGPAPEKWWSIEPGTFELTAGSRRSLVLLLRVPRDIDPQEQEFLLVLRAMQPDGAVSELRVPVNVAIRARR